MLLPQPLQHLREAVVPLATTDVARAVASSARQLLGHHGGVVGLLAIESMWVETFDAFVEIVRATIPQVGTGREARAVAGKSWGLYVPGSGSYLNGSLIAGRTRARLEPTLAHQQLTANAALILAHEAIGHGYIAENTHFGLSQANEQRWRQALAFGARSLNLKPALCGADAALGGHLHDMLIVGEGWAEWVTLQLKPLLAERFVTTASTFAPMKQASAHLIEAPQARALRRLLNEHSEQKATELLTEDHTDASHSARSLGLVLFQHIADRGGAATALQAVQQVCSRRDSHPPNIQLLRIALQP